MGRVQDAWQSNKSTGGIIGNEMEATFRDLFCIDGGMEVPDMYKAIEKVMRRINTYEFEYEADEREA